MLSPALWLLGYYCMKLSCGLSGFYGYNQSACIELIGFLHLSAGLGSCYWNALLSSLETKLVHPFLLYGHKSTNDTVPHLVLISFF